jgi:2-dehydro-3-deoxygluconokinase
MGTGVTDAPAQRRFDLLGLGECMVELFADGPLGTAPALRRAFGGDVLNSLVAATRLGGRCGFISRVADDPFGPAMRQAWADEGMDVSHAPLTSGDNGVYFISVADNGEREFSYRRRDSPASQYTVADLDEAYIAASHMLLLSGITQALSGTMRQATLAAAQMAHRHGVLVAFDPNYRPRLWAPQGGLQAARAALREVAPFVDWLLPSHPADSVLLGDDALALPADDFAGAAQALEGFAALGPAVALKLGPRGCLLRTVAGSTHVEGVSAEKVLDTTGAGDLWNGRFLMGLRQGQAPADAALSAHRLAARKLAHRGAIPPASLYDDDSGGSAPQP